MVVKRPGIVTILACCLCRRHIHWLQAADLSGRCAAVAGALAFLGGNTVGAIAPPSRSLFYWR